MKDQDPQNALNEHVYLFDMMADRLDVNLELAVLNGEISSDEIVEAVRRCSDCSQAVDCAARLPLETDLSKPFNYCRNRELFTDL